VTSVFLANRTATQSAIGIIIMSSVHPSVTLCIVALRVGVQG